MIIGGYHSSSTVGASYQFRPVDTEIWHLEYEFKSNTAWPLLPDGDYAHGIGLFLVPFNFCRWDYLLSLE